MNQTPTALTGAPWIADAAARFVEIIPGHIERLGWSADRVRAHQSRALADLVRTAVDRSPFHRRRLTGLDVDRLTVDQLAELPVMTKAEMMTDLDDVFTDRRLTRSLIDRHLASLGDEPVLLLDEYVVLASGGSSGERGVFVVERDQIAHFTAYVLRGGMAQLSATTGWPPPFRLPVSLVMAPSAIHATRALTGVLSAVADLTYAPATLPIGAIVTRLNDAPPAVLVGYPSVMARLGDAAVAGELRIAPTMMLTTAEQLRPDHVARITAGFGMPPGNSFGSTEGLVGTAAPGSDEFTFASDRTIVEFVDADDRPVPVGRPAHHVLVTNLTSHAQPLIRYRMDDAMTELPPAAGHGHQRATVDGRNDAELTIGGATLHPLTIRSALLRHATVDEFQVRCAADDVQVDIVTSGPTDINRVEHDIEAALASAGATARVSVAVVDELRRNPSTGKIRRFVVD